MAIKRTGPLGPMTQLTSSGGMPLPPIAFYEVLELSLVDMESKREITVYYLPDGIATQVPPPKHTPPLSPPKNQNLML
jgi:hypothetical protein